MCKIGQTEPTTDCCVCGQAKEQSEIVGKCPVCKGNICKTCAVPALARRCLLCDQLTCTKHIQDYNCLVCIKLNHEGHKANCENLLAKAHDEYQKTTDNLAYQIDKTNENISDISDQIERTRE